MVWKFPAGEFDISTYMNSPWNNANTLIHNYANKHTYKLQANIHNYHLLIFLGVFLITATFAFLVENDQCADHLQRNSGNRVRLRFVFQVGHSIKVKFWPRWTMDLIFFSYFLSKLWKYGILFFKIKCFRNKSYKKLVVFKLSSNDILKRITLISMCTLKFRS